MRIFEFHFNPEVKEDLIFDSFCYEPENIYEKRLGGLYIIGELKNTLPQNYRFLDKISSTIKKEYYWKFQRSSEFALKEALKEANEFLSREVSRNNTSWLGNLDLAVIAFKDLILNFTKVGDIKILLLRSGKINEVSKSLDFSEIEPYPLKVFGSIVSGKSTEDDIVMVLTKEVYDYLSGQNLLNEIAKLSPFDEKNLRQIFKRNMAGLSEISGICLMMVLVKETKPIETLTFQKESEKFSLVRIFQPIFNILGGINLKRIKDLIKIPKPHISFRPKLKLPKLPRLTLKLPSLSLPSIPKPSIPRPKIPKIKISLNKNLIYVLVLIFVLLIGFFIFQAEKKENLKLARGILDEVKLKMAQAENALTLGDEERANNLLQEAWQKILPQTESEALLRDEAILIKKSIEEDLAPLNKLEKISEPELLVELKSVETSLVPQRMISLNSTLYIFNPFSSILYEFDSREKIGKKIFANWHLKSAAVLDDLVIFFSRNQDNFPIISFLNDKDEWQEKILQSLSANFSFDVFSSFRTNLYFLDRNLGEIVKYTPDLKETKPIAGKLWFSQDTKKAVSAKSISVDGSIWILTKDNEIDRYAGGAYKETLKPNLFPNIENPTKILASRTSPFIYILDPHQNRIIILTKKGQIFKQYQSEKFNNLLDFSVSDDDTTIWLLNDSQIFKIELQIE